MPDKIKSQIREELMGQADQIIEIIENDYTTTTEEELNRLIRREGINKSGWIA